MDDMVPAVIRLQILTQKPQLWRNTLYDATLDAKIAQALEDEAAKARSAQRMKKALRAIEFLEKLFQEEDQVAREET